MKKYFVLIVGKKYNLLKREYYKSWIPNKLDTTNFQKHQLSASKIDYQLFGEISYNKYIDKYIIQYGFEEVKTMSIQFRDRIDFNTYYDLMNQKLRQEKIHKRLIEEFRLCN